MTVRRHVLLLLLAGAIAGLVILVLPWREEQPASPGTTREHLDAGLREDAVTLSVDQRTRARTEAPPPPPAARKQPPPQLKVGQGTAAFELQVQDPSGGAVAGASVALIQKAADARAPKRFTRSAGGAGTVRVEGAVAGASYRLVVSPPASRPRLARKIIEGWTPKTCVIVLDRAYVVRGTVVDDARGGPVPNARVAWRAGDGAWTGIGTKRGRFEIAGLRQGPLEVKALTRSGFSSVLKVPDVADVDRELTLIVGGATLSVLIEGYDASLHSQAILSIDDPIAGSGITMDAAISKNGSVSFSGLDREKVYRLYVAARGKNGQVVYARGLIPGLGIQPVTVRSTQALSGRVDSPVGTLPVFVTAIGPGFQIHGRVDAKDGTFEIRGLPDVWVDLTARVKHKKVVYRCRSIAKAPDRVTLTLVRP